jgi:sn-glycerol 3-phosphate transport system ATP-binding protein
MNLLPLDNLEVLQWACANMAQCLPQGTLDKVVLGVRPEKISLSDAGLAAVVLSLEYLGADSLIACKIGTTELIVRQSGRVKLAAGDRIHLNWPKAESHFFEAASGQRHTG